MTDEGPDRKVIKECLAFRAKYVTKRQAPRQNLHCWQILPHPKNRGGEPIRATRTRALTIDMLESGFDPTETTVDSIAVEVNVDDMGKPATTFSDHFKANAGLDPDHYFDPGLSILFADQAPISGMEGGMTSPAVVGGTPSASPAVVGGTPSASTAVVGGGTSPPTVTKIGGSRGVRLRGKSFS